MLDLSRIQGNLQVTEYTLDTVTLNTSIAESGLAMVRTADSAGKEVIKPATGGAAEDFVGFLYLDKHAATTGTRVSYAVTVPSSAPYTVSIPDSATSNLISKDAAGSTVAPNSQSGSTLTYLVGQAGMTLYISYNYTLTAAQQAALGISPIPSAAAFIGKAGVLTGPKTRIYITNFKSDDTYTVGGAVKTLANGMVGGAAGSGTAIGKCISVPSAADQLLGIEF
jgi:hypothetical protein